ncbi:GatB/YqeY domain-containing protein [Patescibacteria group bacterium]|nr:GatB/YqeY domain-containing protein [Patescibacteria group bacterium]
MPLKQQIQEDLKKALKAREEPKVGALRMLLAAIQNREKAGTKETELKDQEVQEVVFSEIKKRREATEAYEKGGRPELAAKEQADVAIFQAYLPEQLSQEELLNIVKEAIEETGASGPRDMGKVIGLVMERVKGRAEGAQVSGMVKEGLSS